MGRFGAYIVVFWCVVSRAMAIASTFEFNSSSVCAITAAAPYTQSYLMCADQDIAPLFKVMRCTNPNGAVFVERFCSVIPSIRTSNTFITSLDTYQTVENKTNSIDARVKSLLVAAGNAVDALNSLNALAASATSESDTEAKVWDTESRLQELLYTYLWSLFGLNRPDLICGRLASDRQNEVGATVINHSVRVGQSLLQAFLRYEAELKAFDCHMRRTVGESALVSKALPSGVSHIYQDADEGDELARFHSLRGKIVDENPLSPAGMPCVHFMLTSYVPIYQVHGQWPILGEVGGYRINNKRYDMAAMARFCRLA